MDVEADEYEQMSESDTAHIPPPPTPPVLPANKDVGISHPINSTACMAPRNYIKPGKNCCVCREGGGVSVEIIEIGFVI